MEVRKSVYNRQSVFGSVKKFSGQARRAFVEPVGPVGPLAGTLACAGRSLAYMLVLLHVEMIGLKTFYTVFRKENILCF